MEVWKVGKTFLIHCSSSMLWEMIARNVTCMKIEYIRLKHEKWLDGPLNGSVFCSLFQFSIIWVYFFSILELTETNGSLEVWKVGKTILK
ncbi:hypothetical protein LDENG_00234090, partial [Lucifuga dentata]